MRDGVARPTRQHARMAAARPPPPPPQALYLRVHLRRRAPRVHAAGLVALLSHGKAKEVECRRDWELQASPGGFVALS
jgi:hypothetical protein